ncbi:hypothetical protein AX17_005621 [Amanita inopinata Kibby_2008]|nr:hypothetical protein AX17_005621 [Amanita inopinata Kibby_2008]
MSSIQQRLKFYHLDVFTSTPYRGNSLAIVHIPPGFKITQDKKQLIAQEFNLSETVFLHENENDSNETKIDIFTTTEELQFGGRPTVGSGWHLLANVFPGRDYTTLLIKTGTIPVVRAHTNAGSNDAGDEASTEIVVKLTIPNNFKIHGRYSYPSVKSGQRGLTPDDYMNGIDGPEVVASVTKDMIFILMQLTSTDALARMTPYRARKHIPDMGGSGEFVGIYAFVPIGQGPEQDGLDGTFFFQTRMFDGTLEDPATGSAAGTLAGLLAHDKGKGKWGVVVTQGEEMGRMSEIRVIVDVGDDGKVKGIELLGTAVQVMEGHIWV